MAGQSQFIHLFPCWQGIFLAISSAPEASVHCFHSDITERLFCVIPPTRMGESVKKDE